MAQSEKIKTKKFNKLAFAILIFAVLAIIFYFIFWPKLSNRSSYKTAYAHRFSDNSNYLSRLKHINKNFVMDNTYLVGDRYIEKNFYIWNDKTKMTLDKNLSLELESYFKANSINSSNFSISLVNLKQGDRFNYNEKINHAYINLEKLLINMAILKEASKGVIDIEQSMPLKEVDLTTTSVFFNNDSIGMTYSIKELMKLSFQNNDIPARNMLLRFISDRIKIPFTDLILREFSINLSDKKTSVEEILNLSRELTSNKKIYTEISLDQNTNENEANFLKYIVKKNSTNFTYAWDSSGINIYDFGYINGEISYIYSVFSKNIDSKRMNEIGDLLDRKINEYYLLKNL